MHNEFRIVLLGQKASSVSTPQLPVHCIVTVGECLLYDANINFKQS